MWRHPSTRFSTPRMLSRISTSTFSTGEKTTSLPLLLQIKFSCGMPRRAKSSKIVKLSSFFLLKFPSELCSLEENTKVTSIKWIDECNISFGDSRNRMHVWDATEQTSLRKMRGHAARVSSIAVGQGQVPWLLTCGSKSGEIHNYDVRKPNPFLSKFNVSLQNAFSLLISITRCILKKYQA